MTEQLTPRRQQPKVEEYKLHAEAEELASELATNYAASLVLQGKIIAFQQRANEVQSVHIEQARDIISREDKKGWKKEILLILGSALLGAFAQGFPTELTAGRQLLTTMYVVFGLMGLFLVFLGLRR